MEKIQLQTPASGKYIRFVIYFIGLIVGLLLIIYFSYKKEINRYAHNLIETGKNKVCLMRGGEFVNAGCGIGICNQKCVIPYKDGSKACTNSSQCSGKCVIISNVFPEFTYGSQLTEITGCIQNEKFTYICKLQLAGVCEKRPAANCENFWELNDKRVSAFFADCTI